jgi:WD40 repeat protein
MLGAGPLWTVTLPDYAPEARFSPDGRLLAAATVSGPVLFLDPGTGAELFRSAGHPGGAHSVAWSVMLPLVATGGADGAVALLGARDAATRAQVPLGRGWVDRLAWSTDGTTLAASVGRSVCFLSADGTQRGRFDGHPSTVTGLAWHAARGAFITASYGVLSLLSPDDATPITQRYFRTSLLTVNPSPDGRFVASGTQDPMVHVWDLEDETNEVNLTGYAGKVPVLAWSPAHALLATGAGAGLVMWDFTGGDPFLRPARAVPLEGAGRVTALAFLWSGELLAGTEGGLLWGIDLGPDGEPRGSAILARLPGAVCGVVPSPDGRAVVISIAGGRLVSLALAYDA